MTEIKKYTKKDGSTAHMFNAYLGVDPITGKQKRTTRRGFATKKEAQLALSRLKVEIDERGFKKQEVYTYQDIYELWLPLYRNTVKESTLNKTLTMFRLHILPKFGSLKIHKVSTTYCQKQVNEWFKTFVHFKLYKNYASLVFNHAVKMGVITKNPMDNVTMPKRMEKVEDEEESFVNFYSAEELKSFFAALEGYSRSNHTYRWLAMFRLLAYTGIRRSELLALTWNDVDFTANTLSISKALAIGLNNQPILQTPKTASSRRIISLDGVTLEILKQWRKQQAVDYLKLGFNTNKPQQLIFSNTKNEYVSLPKPMKILNSILKKYNLKRITIHGFRHTHCSLLFEAGATIPEVQERLGHSDVKQTLKIYAHVTQKTKERTADKFAKFMDF